MGVRTLPPSHTGAATRRVQRVCHPAAAQPRAWGFRSGRPGGRTTAAWLWRAPPAQAALARCITAATRGNSAGACPSEGRGAGRHCTPHAAHTHPTASTPIPVQPTISTCGPCTPNALRGSALGVQQAIISLFTTVITIAAALLAGQGVRLQVATPPPATVTATHVTLPRPSPLGDAGAAPGTIVSAIATEVGCVVHQRSHTCLSGGVRVRHRTHGGIGPP